VFIESGHEKAGASKYPGFEIGNYFLLLGEKQISRAFDRFGNPTLFFGRQVRVFSGKNLSRVGDIWLQRVRRREWDLGGRNAALFGFFGSAHSGKTVSKPCLVTLCQWGF
jgi:hypothetical protein